MHELRQALEGRPQGLTGAIETKERELAVKLMPFKPPVAAAQAVISRLLQMRQLWDDAAASYFDPDRFQLALQNCITVSRTVTFILQANKREVEGFDEWYAQHQESWRADPTMTSVPFSKTCGIKNLLGTDRYIW